MLYKKSSEPVVHGLYAPVETESILPEPKAWQPYDLSAFPSLQSKPAPSDPVLTESKLDKHEDIVKKLLDQGLWDEGMNLCLKRIDENALDANAYFYASVVSESLKDHDSAIKYIKKALYIDRNFVLAHYHYGLFNLKIESYALALKAFDNAINLLEKLESQTIILNADGLTAGQLAEMSYMQIEVVEACQTAKSK